MSTFDVCLGSRMLDKLEIRVPSVTPFRKQFEELFCELCADPKGPFRKRGRLYGLTGDLRSYGYEAILHMWCFYGKHDHKIELLDTGKRTFAGCVAEIERIFDIDPLKCGVMRVDCAADVPHIPVSWFHQWVRVLWKQFANEMGVMTLERSGASASVPYAQMGKRQVQTLYFGKRPNCYRIYDKVAEWRDEYQRAIRGHNSAALLKRMKKAGATPDEILWGLSNAGFNPDAEDVLPSFEQIYGIPENGYVLTRCERQVGGGELPTIPAPGKPARDWEKLDTVAALRQRLPDYNPYREFEIVSGAKAHSPKSDTVIMCLAGEGLSERLRRDGMQQTQKWLNSMGRNSKRWLERLAPFIHQPDAQGISSRDLYEIYRNSLLKQLAA